MMKFRRLVPLLVIIGLLLFPCFACTLLIPKPKEEEKLTVLAGSELKDIEPLLPEIKRATGVKLAFQYTGTLDGAQQIAAGAFQDKPVDFAWFAQARYLNLLMDEANHGPGRIQDQQPIMLSPVVLGVKLSKARAWGWVDNPNLTWGDIADKAARGQLRYAMADPASSNSGFTAMLGVASALAEQPDALQARDIRAVRDGLNDFSRGLALTANGSGWLADQYVRRESRLDGMINYESVLLRLNHSGELREPLYMVYPKEGTLTADYPLLLINPAQRDAYMKVVAYLRSPAFQQHLMERTLRRPVDTRIALSGDFPTQPLAELPFPATLEVADQLRGVRTDPQSRSPQPGDGWDIIQDWVTNRFFSGNY